MPVRLVGVTLLRCEDCGAESVRIPRLAQLHRLLARALIEKPGRLAADEVRFLRPWLGLSGRGFARRMGVTPETVSRWESRSAEAGRPLTRLADRALRLLIAHEAPRPRFPSELLDTVDDRDCPALSLRVEVSTNGWRRPVAA